MDETDVTGIHGARENVFGSSATDHVGARGTIGKRIEKHITAIIAM